MSEVFLFSQKNSTDEPAWSGVLGELVHGDGDLAVAALTIMPEHAKHVDFSKPFKYLGITILEKKVRTMEIRLCLRDQLPNHI